MKSLFSRLYAYRERPGRHGMEDFLTEATADLFNRLPRQDKIRMLNILMQLSAAQTASLVKILALDCRVEARTQVFTAAGHRPDIVFYTDDLPTIVLEAKLGAAFQRHLADGPVTEAGAQGKIEVGQLESYSRWIADHRRQGWPGAVVLLTAWTEAPDEFLVGGNLGPIRSVCTWSDLGRWIGAHATAAAGTTHGDLAAELWAFLKEKNLMNRHFNERDLSALSIFTGSDIALMHSFRTVMTTMQARFPKLRRARGQDCGIDSEVGVFWGWRFLDTWLSLQGSKFYVAVGVCTDPGPVFDLDRDKLPANEPFFLVYFGDEFLKRRAADLVSAVPEGWTVVNYHSALICCKPLRAFPAAPDARAEELAKWSIDAFGRLVALLKGESLVSNPPTIAP